MVEQNHEFSAKSVDAAIDEGLRQLGVGREQVDVEVLHEGSRGLLGIGSTNARVRLTLRPVPPKVQKAAPAPAATVPATPTPAPAPQPAASPVAQADDAEQDAADDGDDDEADTDVEEEVVAAPASRRDTGSAGGRDSDSDGDDEEYDDDSDLNREEVVALASEMLLEMVSLMGVEARVESSQRQESDETDSAIYLNLVGGDLGSLIGRQGETLASIQYLVRLMVNQKLHRWTNIVVDVDGYKDRRAERLAQMALRMADQVVETGRPVALEPMPANERRIIHIALRNHPSVYTESIGEDTRRKIQILLK